PLSRVTPGGPAAGSFQASVALERPGPMPRPPSLARSPTMRWNPIVLIALVAGHPSAGPVGSWPPIRLAGGGPVPETIAANDNRRPAGRLEHGVLSLALQVRAGAPRPEEDGGPGLRALAFAEVGQPLQVPGPLIRVPQGTEVRVSLRNPLDSTLTVYGLGARPLPSDSGIVLHPGETREVRFRAATPGTYFYW